MGNILVTWRGICLDIITLDRDLDDAFVLHHAQKVTITNRSAGPVRRFEYLKDTAFEMAFLIMALEAKP